MSTVRHIHINIGDRSIFSYVLPVHNNVDLRVLLELGTWLWTWNCFCLLPWVVLCFDFLNNFTFATMFPTLTKHINNQTSYCTIVLLWKIWRKSGSVSYFFICCCWRTLFIYHIFMAMSKWMQKKEENWRYAKSSPWIYRKSKCCLFVCFLFFSTAKNCAYNCEALE